MGGARKAEPGLAGGRACGGPWRSPKSRLLLSSIRLPDGKPNSSGASSVPGTITYRRRLGASSSLGTHARQVCAGRAGGRGAGRRVLGGGGLDGARDRPRSRGEAAASPERAQTALYQNKRSERRAGQSGDPARGGRGRNWESWVPPPKVESEKCDISEGRFLTKTRLFCPTPTTLPDLDKVFGITAGG